MAMVDADWSIGETSGDIRYIGDDHGGAAPSYATVIEFHRWLQEKADDAVFVGDDQIDITIQTPSDRSTDNIITLINGFNIDALSSEHLYDGSIIQANGNTIYDGIVNFGNTPTLQLIQNGSVIADDWWNEDPTGVGLGLNSDAGAGISHRFMVLVRDSGVDLDGRRLIGTTRNEGKTHAEFGINGTSRGNNVLALSESDDLNNQTAAATVATWTDIVNDNEGYTAIDASGDGVDEFYYSDWELGLRSINDFYERAKWLTREGSTETLYGLPGELFRGITHEIDIDNTTGTFVEPEAISWTGGTGQLLAIDDVNDGTKMYIQLLTGTPPSDGVTITGNSNATADVNIDVIERPISIPFVGASTGSALIGAYGLGVGADDLIASDTVFDLTNTPVNPPNNVTFTVQGVVVGEDRILVGPESGGTLNTSQLSLSVTLSADDVTSVVVSTPIPTDTPATGTIRVADDDGLFRRLEYSSYNGSTFTISSSDGNEDFATVGALSGNNVFISYIDKLATSTSEIFTGVYLSDRPLFVRVRDGGLSPIRTFETTGTLGSAGGSATVIRTTDE